MSEQQRIGRSGEQQGQVEQTHVPQHSTTDDGFDALLDEIDGLLENNAAEYVRSFVQKGGQ